MKRLMILTTFLAATAALLPSAVADPTPVVYAHRGGAEIAPENTVGAFENAHDTWGGQGIWLELDAQLTSDGHLVVIHDATLDRTTDCSGNVIDHTLAEVTACDAAWPHDDKPDHTWSEVEPVPTLKEVLTEGKTADWRLLVELKNIPGEPNFDPTGFLAAQVLVDLVDETGFPTDSLVVQSFFPTSLDAVQVLNPDIDLALLTTSQLPGAPEGVGFTLRQNALYATARQYEVSAPQHVSSDMNAETVEFAHTLGRDVVVWTPNDADRIDELVAMGVDGVITDDPGLALDG